MTAAPASPAAAHDDDLPHRGRAFRVAERQVERLEAALVLDEPSAQLRAEVETSLAGPRLDPRLVDELQARLLELERARSAAGGLTEVAARRDVGGVERFVTSGGIEIFRLRAETFPRHINYAYLFEVDGSVVLWDVGTGQGTSREDLLRSLRVAAAVFGAPAELSGIDVIFISHGHIDHFGDVRWFVEQTQAELWVHELDARVLEHFAERMILSGRDLRAWLQKAGLDGALIERLVRMNLTSKELFDSGGISVSRRLRHGQELFGGRARVIHTPGHCPGHVCLHIDDALLVADQVLAPITPHISPQALHPHNGLERYLAGLARLRLVEGVRHVLPAHYDPIPDLGARIDEIAHHHAEQAQLVMGLCPTGQTVSEVALGMYGERKGYDVLLAVLEAGAHVEYLHQLGILVIDNLDELLHDHQAPIRYRATDEPAPEPRPVSDRAD